MKFLAVLKDSFREAVDGWVIYVMVVLSTLFILLVALIGFKPVEGPEAFQAIVHDFRAVFADHNNSAVSQYPLFGVSFQVSGVEKLTDARRPQDADYRFHLTAKDSGMVRMPKALKPAEPNAANDAKPEVNRNDSEFLRAVAFWSKPAQAFGMGSADAAGVSDDQILDFVKDLFQFYGNIDVSKIERKPSTAPDEFDFDIWTKGHEGVRGWLHEPTVLFGAFTLPFKTSLGNLVYIIQDVLVNGFGAWIALLVGVILTAFFMPNMMRKGSIDLLLSKPLSRWSLLLFKYVGGLTFVFINTAYAVVGIWLVMGIRSGIWSNGFLLTIFAITFYFAILYAVSTLFGVLSRNAIVAILVTIAFWFFLWIAGQAYSALDVFRHEKTMSDRVPQWVYTVGDTLNTILPRTSDLNKLTNKMVVQDTMGEGDKRRARLDNLTWPSWGEVLGVSLAHIGIMLGLAVWRFSTRDY